MQKIKLKTELNKLHIYYIPLSSRMCTYLVHSVSYQFFNHFLLKFQFVTDSTGVYFRAVSRLVLTQIRWPSQSNSSVKHFVLQHCLHNGPKIHLAPAGFGQDLTGSDRIDPEHKVKESLGLGPLIRGLRSNFFIFRLDNPPSLTASVSELSAVR